MNRIDLSVVIVNWNTRALLDECIASIKTHGSCTKEIIVVDNGSSDGSLAMLSIKHRDVVVLANGRNLGFSRANNIGIRQSHGRYVVLLNSDTRVLDDTLDRMLRYAEENRSVGMLGGRLLNTDGSVQASGRAVPSLLRAVLKALFTTKLSKSFELYNEMSAYRFDYGRTAPIEALCGAFLLVRREAFMQVGELDERFFFYAEDIDWSKRFWDAGWTVVYYSDSNVVHYGGASSSAARVSYRLEMMKADMVYMEKHFSACTVASYQVVTLIHHLLRGIGAKITTALRFSERDHGRYLARRELACARWIVQNRGHRVVSTARNTV